MSESREPEGHDNSDLSCPRFRSDRVGSHEDDDEDSQIPQFAHGDEIPTHRRNPQTPSRLWRRQGEGDEPEVLEPDNPLMTRFQAALKIHLERQYNRINEEVLELRAETKKKKLEHEELGVSLYSMEQNVMKQQNLIGKYHETLATLTKLREEMEFQVEASRAIYKSEQQKLNFAQNKEEELHTELESLICLERQFSDWEKEMESELAVSERISEKTKVDKKKLTEEMHRKDIFILKLMTEVANLEARLIALDGQFQLKEVEREKVGQALADANADMDVLNKEQHRLVQSWNSVVVSIQQRDKVHTKITNDYKKVQEEFQTVTNEIEGYKKASNEEMLKNERLTIILNKVHAEQANLERLYTLEEEKKVALEIQLSKVNNILEQTDRDLQQVMSDCHKKMNEDKMLQKTLEKLCNDKISLEDRILENLQDQITQDKAAKYLNKVLSTLRNKTRDQQMLTQWWQLFCGAQDLDAHCEIYHCEECHDFVHVEKDINPRSGGGGGEVYRAQASMCIHLPNFLEDGRHVHAVRPGRPEERGPALHVLGMRLIPRPALHISRTRGPAQRRRINNHGPVLPHVVECCGRHLIRQ